MRLLSALVLFLSAAVAVGEPVSVPDGQPADLKVVVPKGASVVWRYYPPPTWKAADLPPGRAIFAGKSGSTVTATAIVIDFKAQTVTDTEFEVTFGGRKADPSPDPTPDPKPKPDPKPGPVGTLYLVVIEETSKRTPEQAAVLNDAAFWRGLAARDVKWRLYDQDSPDLPGLGYLPDARLAGIPAVMVYDARGKLHYSGKLPGRVADLDAVVKGVGR